MNLQKLDIALLTLLVVAMVPCVSAAENVNADKLSSDPFYLEAIKIMSKENALASDRLIPLNVGIASYPLTNKKIHAIKVLDQKNGDTYTLYLDEKFVLCRNAFIEREESRD